MRIIPDKIELALKKDLSMADFHHRMAELRGDKVVCKLHEPLRYESFRKDELSFNEAAEFVEKTSSALADMGIRPGERVGICTSNNVDLPLSIFAIARAGAVAVPMNYMLKANEMRYILEDCGAEVFIVDREVCDPLAQLVPQELTCLPDGFAALGNHGREGVPVVPHILPHL
jgi:fatty-acyl-CoA synthase